MKFPSKVQQKLILRGKQLYTLFLLSLSFIVVKLFKSRKEHLWIFSEKYSEARDNGYWLFMFVKQHHPDIDARFLLKKKSPDRDKLGNYKKYILEPNSWNHYKLIWQSTGLISSQQYGGLPSVVVDSDPLVRLCRRFLPKCKWVFLQHGVIKDKMHSLCYPKFITDLFICGAKPEFDYIKKEYGYPEGVVRYTGLARFDNLHDVTTNPKQILLMPTWRSWITTDNFDKSQYFECYRSLLQSKKLIALLEKHGLKLVFFPHFRLQRLGLLAHFQNIELSEAIIIASKEKNDVQQLLKESVLLVTDYSSVFFDFAYMKKPIIYYQFDEAEYRQEHYSEGYYNYHEGLGMWASTEEELLNIITEVVESGMRQEKKHALLAEEFFPLHDQKNCERNYEAILSLF